MLVSKIPVLDKGYAALLGSTLAHPAYKNVIDELFAARDNKNLDKVCYATILIKAPLFVQLHLAQHGLTMVSTRVAELDAYVPNAGEVGAKDHAVSKDIADDIQRTTDALLINPAAYKADGCDPSVAQNILPISTYATSILGGSLEQWKAFYQYKSVPAAIRAYADTIEQIIKAEWKHV